jgi:hypothetical protein
MRQYFMTPDQLQLLDNLKSLIDSLEQNHIGLSFLKFFTDTFKELKYQNNCDNLSDHFLDELHESEKTILKLLEKENEKEHTHFVLEVIYNNHAIDLEKFVLEYELKKKTKDSGKNQSNKI